MNANTLTQDQLKTLLHYDPDTGVFTWLPRDVSLFKTRQIWTMWRGRYLGKVAGCVNAKGYIEVRVPGKLYKAHRLAFLYMTGAFPEGEVDHINHIRDDNKWDNLRVVTGKENQQNRKLTPRHTSGIMGVSWDNVQNKWRAKIHVEGRIKYLGRFATLKEAAAARKQAEKKYGYHPNHGT